VEDSDSIRENKDQNRDQYREQHMEDIGGEENVGSRESEKDTMDRIRNKRDKQESKINSQGHENALKMELRMSECTASHFRNLSS
jgi:hypothetical protein